jgi:hypothetical protein
LGGYERNTMTDLYSLADAYKVKNPQSAFVATSQPNPAVQSASQDTPGQDPSGLQDLYQRYAQQSTDYREELKAARARAQQESQAFNDLIKTAVATPAQNAPSKSEIYFRLASAFGAPTRTGKFSESLINAGEAISGYDKEELARQALNKAKAQALQIQLAQANMGAAKEDVTAIRQLAGEEMKDQRAMLVEMLKEKMKTQGPQSSEGKAAWDMGMRPGTPEFSGQVKSLADLNRQVKLGMLGAAQGNVGIAQGNQALSAERLLLEQQKQAEASAAKSKLTPAELKLKIDTENADTASAQVLNDISRAYDLNPHTFDNSIPDRAQRLALEAAGSKAPKVINTRELENLLGLQAVGKLKETFPGAISDGERKELMKLQGIGAMSIEERERVIKRAYVVAKNVRARVQKRLADINAGNIRLTTPTQEAVP